MGQNGFYCIFILCLVPVELWKSIQIFKLPCHCKLQTSLIFSIWCILFSIHFLTLSHTAPLRWWFLQTILPSSASTQLQFKLRLRLALIPLSPVTQPPTRPPKRPPTRNSRLSQTFQSLLNQLKSWNLGQTLTRPP